jgi:hypothetical protein
VHEAIAQRLRDLPAEEPVPFDWLEMRRRMQSGARPVRSHSPARRHALAVAASFTALVVFAALYSRLRLEHAPAARSAPVVAAGGDASARATFDERLLAAQPRERAIVRVSTRLAVTDLEDRIASVDDQLNAARLEQARTARVRALQRERTRLMDSLVQVRYADMLAAELP